MKYNDESYLRNFPWKGSKCTVCNKLCLIKGNEKFCDDCRSFIHDLPPAIGKRLKNGEITKREATEMVSMIRKAEDVARIGVVSCNVTGFKERIDDEEFYETVRRLGKFTCSQVAAEMGISLQTAYKYLNQYLEEGIVEKERCGKFVFWSLARQVPGSSRPDKNGRGIFQ